LEPAAFALGQALVNSPIGTARAIAAAPGRGLWIALELAEKIDVGRAVRELRAYAADAFPTLPLTAGQVRELEAFVNRTGMRVAIRATDPVTALVTRALSHLGITFRVLFSKRSWRRSDADIAWVSHRGKDFLTDRQTLKDINGPLNRSYHAIDEMPAFMHGGHRTAYREFGGPLSWDKLAKIGNPGPVIEVGRVGRRAFHARDVLRLRIFRVPNLRNQKDSNRRARGSH
jgi:hypothetical protein